MEIVELHAQARGQLVYVLHQRYMPKGWSREGDRKVAKCLTEAHRILTELLQSVPDRLIIVQDPKDLREFAQAAAENRTLKGMVAATVKLLSSGPEVDQETAFGIASLKDSQLALVRLQSRLAVVQQELNDMQAASEALGLDLIKPLGLATHLAQVQAKAKAEELEQQGQALIRGIQPR